MKFFGSMDVVENQITVGGVKCADMVKEYGTPLYVYDEELIRDNCRRYKNAIKAGNRQNRVAYAGKAFLTLAMCDLVKEEGLWLDVVSGGELFTAYKSGFPMERVYFHGNNKTVEEIEMGVKLGVGRFVADNFSEMEYISAIASENNKTQKILLRITPGIEAHTHDYIKTGQIDSKFGFTVLNDNTLKAVRKAVSMKNIDLVGIHCHIGSQIFDTEPYKDATNIMLALMQNIYEETGHMLKELDLGGGFGIYYKDGDMPHNIEKFCSTIINAYEIKCKELTIEPPILTIEPGRSIVGNAGITLYTVGAIKEIPEIRKYVAVDGGMTDNIRPALYRAQYECVIANRVMGGTNEQVTISGKCCESGDILLSDIIIPEVESGDILAVLSTGAYGYSMASNYNKIPKAAVIIAKAGKTRLICRRETYEDVIKNEII